MKIGISCIEERKVNAGNEELIFHYVNGIRIDEVINMFHFFGASGTEYYYHYDGKGWVIALTEGSESGQTPGEVHRRYEYTPYGVTSIFTDNYTAVSENDAFDVTDNGIAYNRTLYAGREYDPETNLYYYRARHYSPETGRFIQRDPDEYGDPLSLMNLYCYAASSPVNYSDPSGFKSEVTLWFAAFIHKDLGDWMNEPLSLGTCQFSGDSRDFFEKGTSRLYTECTVDLDKVGSFKDKDLFFGANYTCKTDTGKSHRKWLDVFTNCWKIRTEKAIPHESYYSTNTHQKDYSYLQVTAWANYPFLPQSPAIDYQVRWRFKRLNKGEYRIDIAGQHNEFPFYEAKITDSRGMDHKIYTYYSKHEGPTLGNLSGIGNEQIVNQSGYKGAQIIKK